MKLLVLTLRYPPYTAGGYELLTRDAVEGLRARGHAVEVLAGRGERFAGVPGVHAAFVPSLDESADPWADALEASTKERVGLHLFRSANYRATRKVLRAVEPDAVLFFNMGLLSLAPLLAVRHAGIPSLGYVADPWPTNHWLASWKTDPLARRTKAARLGMLERAWTQLRDMVELGPLCVASGYLEELLASSGIDPETIDVLPLGLPPDVQREAAGAEVLARSEDEPLRVVCASSLWEGKGQDVLIEAVAQARGFGANVELTLAGGGKPDFRARLDGLVDALGLASSVRFEGVLERDALCSLLRRSHVLVLPSTWGEPFGLVTLEGMAFGLGVIASDAGASPELVEDGVDGRIVTAGDAAALARVFVDWANDDAHRQRCAREGRATVGERFDYDTFLARLELALQAVVPPR